MIQLQLPLEARFKHECPDWDFLEIDETRPEFEACCCEFGIEADEIRVRLLDVEAPYADPGPIDFLEAL